MVKRYVVLVVLILATLAARQCFDLNLAVLAQVWVFLEYCCRRVGGPDVGAAARVCRQLEAYAFHWNVLKLAWLTHA